MLRRILPLTVSGLASVLLVLLLDGTPPAAHATLFVPGDAAQPDYVPEDSIGVDDAARDAEPEASLPGLTGRGGPRPEDDDRPLTEAELRELIEKTLKEPLIHDIHESEAITLIDIVTGFPKLTPDERAYVMRVMRALAERLDELAHTPNDQGGTWASNRGTKAEHVFVQTTIPGWGESYQDAARRLIERAIEDAAYGLPAEKAKTWAHAAKKAAAGGSPLEAIGRILSPKPRLHIRTPWMDTEIRNARPVLDEADRKTREVRLRYTGTLKDLTRSPARVVR
ncbi:MAG: hypothetical protein QNJ98_20335 [Planctomycetota bacterium]|nr:hypothetical protein [Planctomycetota bacterium]